MIQDKFDFGELRSLLAQRPSAPLWSQLCALLSSAAAQREAASWLAYVNTHLDYRWPEALRTLPPEWIWSRPEAIAAARVLRLDADTTHVTERLLELLEEEPHQIERLDVRNTSALAAPQRERLWLALQPTLRAASLSVSDRRVWPEAEWLAGLRELGVRTGRGEQPFDGALLRAPLPELRALEVRRDDIRFDGNAPMLAPLMESQLPAQLEQLTLALPVLFSENWAQLIARPWPQLRVLALEFIRLGPRNLLDSLLVQAPALRELRLRLLHSPERADRALLIEQLDQVELPQLERFELAGAGTHYLLRCSFARHIRSLTLARLDPSIKIFTLLPAHHLEQVEQLDLSFGPGAAMSGWDVDLPRLRSLSIAGAKIDAASATALADTPLLSLSELDLGECWVDEDAAPILERAPWRAQLIRSWRRDPNLEPLKPPPTSGASQVLGTIDRELLGPPMRRRRP